MAALLVLALSIPGLGSIFSLVLILLILDIVSQREKEGER